MQIHLQKVGDTLSRDLRARYRAADDKAGIHRAMGLGIVALAKRSFNTPSLRPKPWPAKADGSAARLRDTGTLAKSLRVVSANEIGALVGSDRRYAAIHQLGGKTRPHVIRPKHGKALYWPGASHPVKKVDHPGSDIPARPFFPFLATGRPSMRALTEIERIVRAKLRPKSGSA